jgi:F-type H+-transporting ATPase subunit delta
MTGAAPRRYAKALFALAKDAGVLQPTAAELGRLAGVASDPTVGAVLGSPLLSAPRRAQLLALLARELRLSDLTTRFVNLLGEHSRLRALPAIYDYYERLLDADLGRVRLTIRTARALEATQQQSMIAAFASLTQREVIPTLLIDPELLGGVVVEVEGKVYDGSVRNQLERIAKELTGTTSSL